MFTIGNYILPTDDGEVGQILKTDGLGNVTWSDPIPEVVSDPVSPISGQMWFNTTMNEMRVFINNSIYKINITPI